LLRVEEMHQSINSIFSVLNKISKGPIKVANKKIVSASKKLIMKSMEALISHFKLHSLGFKLIKGYAYNSTEAPKGEFGIFLIIKNKFRPYRCKIRAPGFFHLQAINYIVTGHFLADIVTVIGTLDIVFGEIDR